MGDFKSYKDISRLNWGSADPAMLNNCERIKLGAVLRIADAAELMAQNHRALIEEREQFKRWYEDARAKVKRCQHQIRGLRGVITKLKAK